MNIADTKVGVFKFRLLITLIFNKALSHLILPVIENQSDPRKINLNKPFKE